jgi:hypothetical protein
VNGAVVGSQGQIGALPPDLSSSIAVTKHSQVLGPRPIASGSKIPMPLPNAAVPIPSGEESRGDIPVPAGGDC